MGQRCHGLHDWHARGPTHVMGALIGKDLLTVGLFAVNVDADVFTGWARPDLLPKLPPSSVVVMDNATFHKRPATQAVILGAGHTLEYLPPIAPTSIPSNTHGRTPNPFGEKQALLSSKFSPTPNLNHS